MQEEPLEFFAYIIGCIPFIKRLKVAYSDITQPCYGDNTGALGIYGNIKLYFIFLKQSSLGRGYYPYPSKIILIMHRDNTKNVNQFGFHHWFMVFTGVCYIGNFIGDDYSKHDWIQDRALKRGKKCAR